MKQTSNALKIGGENGDISVNSTVSEYYWRQVNFSFKTSQEVPCTREQHTACIHGDHVYVMGGHCGTVGLKDLWRYHLTLHSWERVDCRGDMLPHLKGHTILSNKSLMYVFGGEFNQDITETPLWIYNPDLNHIRKLWVEPGHRHPSPRRAHSAVMYRGVMYLYGGYVDISGSSAELWAFDTDQEEWQYVPQTQAPKKMAGSRHGHTAVVYTDRMWVLGGMAGLTTRDDFWAFCFKDKEWTQVKARQCPALSGHSATVVGDSMFVFGGDSPDYILQSTLWRFHFKSSTWQRVYTNLGVVPARAGHMILAKLPTSDDRENEAASRSHSYPVIRKDKAGNRAPRNVAGAVASGAFNNRVTPDVAACETDEVNTDEHSNSGLMDMSRSIHKSEYSRCSRGPDKENNEPDLYSSVEQMIEMKEFRSEKHRLIKSDILDLDHQHNEHGLGLFDMSSCECSMVDDTAVYHRPACILPQSDVLPQRRSIHATDVFVEDLDSLCGMNDRYTPGHIELKELVRRDAPESIHSNVRAMPRSLVLPRSDPNTIKCGSFTSVRASNELPCDNTVISVSRSTVASPPRWDVLSSGPVIYIEPISNQPSAREPSMPDETTFTSRSDVVSPMSEMSLDICEETTFSEDVPCDYSDQSYVSLAARGVARVPSETRSMVEQRHMVWRDNECSLLVIGGRDETQKMFAQEGLPVWKCIVPYIRS